MPSCKQQGKTLRISINKLTEYSKREMVLGRWPNQGGLHGGSNISTVSETTVELLSLCSVAGQRYLQRKLRQKQRQKQDQEAQLPLCVPTTHAVVLAAA